MHSESEIDRWVNGTTVEWADLADTLDISHQALSERLRRGTGNLIENALVVDEDEAQSNGE